MQLLLGNLNDPICRAILASLEARGEEARMMTYPMSQPLRLAWRLDTATSVSRLILEDGTSLLYNEIEGVLVRRPECRIRTASSSNNLAYDDREANAALLAWLWSLDCPVINRYPAALWHIAYPPLLFWQSRLTRCGLRALPSLISNVEQEARDFGAGLNDEILYAPLTASSRYRLGGCNEWKKLNAMQRIAPVHLTQACAASHIACVVGHRVIWEGARPTDAEGLERALTHFSAVAGLDFVEIEMALTHDGMSVTAVNPDSDLKGFGEAAQREIVLALIQLLTAEVGSLHAKRYAQSERRIDR